ncbi:coiled-coil domain-containing protein 127-like [Acanthaster planci]|uniref:Coiled-coil domain-containing protein 127-like n=1 Tax=Acanthaster planci TaxID=133434 RepID=A0A8B7ZFZ3_ACAPL|nr:coiled-coil domain-containing protein 127-like [Acanthaster planci]XP_022104525.1 coiled-coil domain-containing protein 127-like [Acanthaster planci]
MATNDLNIPPTEEPIGKKLSRIASQLLIPVLLPASSIFFGWLAQRRISIQLNQLQKEKERIADLKEDVDFLQDEVKNLSKRRLELEEKTSMTTIKRRCLLEEAIIKEENQATQKILTELEELRPLLKQRQDIYCNPFKYRGPRLELESQLLFSAYFKPYDKDLGLYVGMQNILKHDQSCSQEGNGCLMWVYLQLWKTRAELLKHRRVAARMKEVDESFAK